MTKPYGDLKKAKLLIIGHDPRLQRSNTLAEYCFFADYYFSEVPKSASEKSKYKLAEALFSYINYLAGEKYTPEEVYITNLCNRELEHAPNKRTVLIPKVIAQEGVDNIKKIVDKSFENGNARIELILALSQQVNYWLQVFDFINLLNNM